MRYFMLNGGLVEGDGRTSGTETVRAVKDTVGALEDDATLYHLSHDTPH